jgi:hypothetical protein
MNIIFVCIVFVFYSIRFTKRKEERALEAWHLQHECSTAGHWPLSTDPSFSTGSAMIRLHT